MSSFFCCCLFQVANCLAFEKERLGLPGELEIVLGNFEWDKSHEETVVRKVYFLQCFGFGLVFLFSTLVV